MKIKKIKPANGSSILAEQARILGQRDVPSAGEEYLSVNERKGFKEAMLLLEAENVEPLSVPPRISAGELADPSEINLFFRDVKADLDSLNSNLVNIRRALLNRHNLIALKENSIIGLLKTLRSKISTLKLYSRDLGNNNLYTHFSFTDAEEIQKGNSMYIEAEGALTLPRKPSGVKRVGVARITIDEESNGSPGFANKAGNPLFNNDNLDLLIDRNEHTWFEYEVQKDDGQRFNGVKLVLNIYLQGVEIINQIVIRPTNLGTPTWVQIDDITVSHKTVPKLISIKNDMISSDWEEESFFSLAPATSKYAGEGIFTFLPRKANFIKITLSQKSPYQVETTRGSKKRYAIALRSIEINSIRFEESGEFELRRLDFAHPIRAMGFNENLAPGHRELSKMSYLVSSNEGQDWTEVHPLSNSSKLNTEALIFDAPTRSLLLKGKIERTSEGFVDFKEKTREYIDVEKIIPVPTSSAPVKLEHKQLSYTEVIRIGLGTVGDEIEPTIIGYGKSTPGDKTVYNLDRKIAKEDLVVLVNNEKWTSVPNFQNADGTLNVSSPNFIYDEHTGNGQIVFGDGGRDLAAGNLGGRAVPIGAEIAIFEKADKPKVSLSTISGRYEVHLSKDSAKSVSNTVLFWTPDFFEIKTDGLAFFASDSLEASYDINHAIPYGAGPTISYHSAAINPPNDPYFGPVAFINGEQEFTERDFPGVELAVGQWVQDRKYFSIDRVNHRVYLSAPPSSEAYPLTFRYSYYEKYRFSKDQLKYLPFGEITRADITTIDTQSKLIITDPTFRPRNIILDLFNNAANAVVPQYAVMNERVLHVNYKIVEGTLTVSDNSPASPWLQSKLATEVEFVNGAEEFEGIAEEASAFSIDYRGAITDGQGSNICIPGGAPWTDLDIPALAGGATGSCLLLFQSADIEAHYMKGEPLTPERDFFPKKSRVDFSPDFILSQSRSRSLEKRILIRYDILAEEQEDGAEIEEYYTPVLRDLIVTGITIDPRLSGLEDL